jgi:hypothetical protein
MWESASALRRAADKTLVFNGNELQANFAPMEPGQSVVVPYSPGLDDDASKKKPRTSSITSRTNEGVIRKRERC